MDNRLSDFAMQQFLDENKELKAQRDKDLQNHIAKVAEVKKDLQELKLEIVRYQFAFDQKCQAKRNELTKLEQSVSQKISDNAALKADAEEQLEVLRLEQEAFEQYKNEQIAKVNQQADENKALAEKLVAQETDYQANLKSVKSQEAQLRQVIDDNKTLSAETEKIRQQMFDALEEAKKKIASAEEREHLAVQAKTELEILIKSNQDLAKRYKAETAKAEAAVQSVAAEKDGLVAEKAALKDMSNRLAETAQDQKDMAELLKKQERDIDKKIRTLKELRRD